MSFGDVCYCSMTWLVLTDTPPKSDSSLCPLKAISHLLGGEGGTFLCSSLAVMGSAHNDPPSTEVFNFLHSQAHCLLECPQLVF